MKKFQRIMAGVLTAASMLVPVSTMATSNASNASGTSNAALEDTLVIYSTHPEEMLTKVAEGFTAKTGVKVEFVNLKGELAQRVRSEKDNPQADIMYGGSSSLLINMEKEGLFEKVDTTWAKDMNPQYMSKEGFWYGTIKTPVVIFYNKDKVAADKAPASWEDLAKPEFKDMIVSRDAGSSSQKAAIVALRSFFTKQNGEEKAVEYLKNLDANTLNYYANGGMHFQAVGKGDAPISYAVLSAVDENVKKNSMPLTTVVPKEGAIVILDCIAMVKNAKHPEAAKAFVEYAGSPEVQNMLAKEFGRMPVLEAAMDGVPEYMKAPMTEMAIDWYEIAETESKWTEDWTNNIKDAAKDIKGN